MNKEEILKLVKKEGFIEMESETGHLTIHFRHFFNTRKEFLFMLNAKAVKDCKTDLTALKHIDNFINKGFKLLEDEN